MSLSNGMARGPRVSVLMSVYNCGDFVAEAIESILHQSYRDFEFIIINDASGDTSAKIIASYDDPRIRVISNEKNLGLTVSLNKGLGLCRGEYIARMDADDISLPERFAEQISYMDSHPELGVCGTWTKSFGDSKGKISFRHPEDPEEIRCMFLFENCIAHPTVFMRKSLLERFGLKYDETAICAQDYELWTRASQYFPLANISKALLLHRNHENQIGVKHTGRQLKTAAPTRRAQLLRLGLQPSREELDLHEAICIKKISSDRESFERIEAWFDRILEANRKTKLYNQRILKKTLGEQFLKSWVKSANRSLSVLPQVLLSPYGRSLDAAGLAGRILKSVRESRAVYQKTNR